MKKKTVKSRVFMLLVILYQPFNIAVAERWYSETQVEKGRIVFDTYCASCHGVEAAGIADWRKPMADGRYPAPPLNGTAHGWEHSLTALRQQIKKGGTKIGGWMPALGDSVTDKQANEAIAYFQSLWPDKVYAAWLKRDLAASKAKKNSSSAKELDQTKDSGNPNTIKEKEVVAGSNQKEILRHLISQLPNAKFGEAEETPLKGIFRLSMDDNIIYVSSDGRYVFLGDMIDLVSGRNISKKGVP